MICKVNRPGKDTKKVYTNSGSVRQYVDYLGKEDAEKGIDREWFFNHDRDDIIPEEVIRGIDKNRHGLGKNDTKFYSVILAPEEGELEKLMYDKKLLKDYTRNVMDIYARGFNGRDGKNKGLKGSDLNYFCKLEDNRYYKGTDEEVKMGVVKQGDKKPGTGHVHIHIIVGRKDKANKYKISPLVNQKKLFHLNGFQLKAGYKFDRMVKKVGSARYLEAHMEKKAGHRKEIEQYAGHKYQPEPEQIKEPEQKKDNQPEQEKDKDRDRGRGLSF